MARDLIDFLNKKLPLKLVLFDSWYSDKKLISKLITKGIHVICGIKTNRKICLKPWKWEKLSTFSKLSHDFSDYFIDEEIYKISSYKAKLEGLPFMKMLISKQWNEKENKWSENFHLISTNRKLNVSQIIRLYSKRWAIETFHRDIKQNLGFAKAFIRNKTAIVRHSIFVVLAYAVLKLFMLGNGLKKTIGECCSYIQDKEMDGFVLEIIEIEDKKERMDYYNRVFIRKTAKL